MSSCFVRYGEIHPHFYMGPLTEAIQEAGGASAKEVCTSKASWNCLCNREIRKLYFIDKRGGNKPGKK